MGNYIINPAIPIIMYFLTNCGSMYTNVHKFCVFYKKYMIGRIRNKHLAKLKMYIKHALDNDTDTLYIDTSNMVVVVPPFIEGMYRLQGTNAVFNYVYYSDITRIIEELVYEKITRFGVKCFMDSARDMYLIKDDEIVPLRIKDSKNSEVGFNELRRVNNYIRVDESIVESGNIMIHLGNVNSVYSNLKNIEH